MVRSSVERSPQFYAGCAGWAIACGWLVWQDLGSIAFVGSCLLAIWGWGLRDKFASDTERSAYSVFNPGGRGIPGGTSADQLDQQLRGMGTNSSSNNNNNKSSTAASSSSSDDKAPVHLAEPIKKLGERDKLKRRSAAAAAAERRLNQPQSS